MVKMMIDMNNELQFEEEDSTIQRIHSTFGAKFSENVDTEWLLSYLDFVSLNMARDKEYAGLIELFSERKITVVDLEIARFTIEWLAQICA